MKKSIILLYVFLGLVLGIRLIFFYLHQKTYVKGEDVHLVVDLVSGAYENLYDIAIIVSGDEDFVPAIKAVQEKAKKSKTSDLKKNSPGI